jgi:hypothetical protein
LADDKDFKAVRASIGGAPQGLLYVDTGALGVALYDVLMPVAQIAPRNPQVDVTALPTSELLMRNLSAAVFGLTADADGVIMEGYSPTGGVALLGLVPAIAGGQRVAARQGRREANRNRDIADQLSRDLKAYAQENGGKYPATLKEMQPKYLANVNAAEVEQIVYRGQQDAGNKVVAHSPEARMGPITILTQDGTVAMIPRRILGKVLQQGLTAGDAIQPGAAGGAAGAPPAGGEAVKPPKPPEF